MRELPLAKGTEKPLKPYVPPHERVTHYRDMAAEALRSAALASDPDQKIALATDAARWLTLALEVEHVWEKLTANSGVATGEVQQKAG